MKDSTGLMLSMVRMQIEFNGLGNNTMKRKRNACMLIHGALSTSHTFVKFCKDNPKEKKSISRTGTFPGVNGKTKRVGKLPYFAIGLSL